MGFPASLEENARAYFNQKRVYEEDLKTFLASLKGKPPKNVEFCLTTVRVFLMENGIDLPVAFWRRLKGRRSGTRALLLGKVPSNAELRRILSHMDVKDKSLFLVLASSGMRRGEEPTRSLQGSLGMGPLEVIACGRAVIAYVSSEYSE